MLVRITAVIVIVSFVLFALVITVVITVLIGAYFRY